MDPDVVVADNIDKIFTHKSGQWLICRDFTRAMRPNWERFNSSVMRWEAGEHEFIYTNFINNAMANMRRFLRSKIDMGFKQKILLHTLSDEWIRSWKWEIRKQKILNQRH